jgi:uncharacterized membrane protein
MTVVSHERKWAAEWRRSAIALIASVAMGVLLFQLLTGHVGAGAAASLAALVALDTWCLTYVMATWRAFAGAGADVLAELLSPTTAPTWIAILRGGSNGPSIAILCAGVGLIGAALLPRVERVGTGPVVTGALTALSLLSLALCWLALTAGFAVHYVRMDMRHDGLRFPGTDHPTFGDYVYFSVAVATTFGATDVAVVHPRLRRVVTGHGVLAFVFNTVVLALVVNVVSH